MSEVRLARPEAGASPSGERIRILVVEDHQMVADGLATLLNDETDMEVVSSAESVAASAKAAGLRPDIVLVDFHLPDGNGIDAAAAVRAASPESRIIFLTRDDGFGARMAALEAGAAGLIHKSRAAQDVVEAIRLVARGGTLFPPDAVASLLAADRTNQSQRESITARELEVLRLTAEGVASRKIASRLGVSYTTVRTHLRSLDSKLGAHSKLEAIMKARELGLID